MSNRGEAGAKRLADVARSENADSQCGSSGTGTGLAILRASGRAPQGCRFSGSRVVAPELSGDPVEIGKEPALVDTAEVELVPEKLDRLRRNEDAREGIGDAMRSQKVAERAAPVRADRESRGLHRDSCVECRRLQHAC